MTTSLDAVDTSGGIAVPNFFNGRILSAEDLRLVLAADRRHRCLLGPGPRARRRHRSARDPAPPAARGPGA